MTKNEILMELNDIIFEAQTTKAENPGEELYQNIVALLSKAEREGYDAE